MTNLTEALDRFFKSSPDPVLFAGAGVSARAGIPTWPTLLERLKEWIRSRDALTANQMAEYIHEKDLITAADYFFLSRRVTDGERLKAIVSQLGKYDHKKIVDLVQLPFNSYVTTNFDRCLLDAYSAAHSKSLLDFKYGDMSFKQAQWCTEPFAVRIHGGIEMPTAIVLKTEHFEQVDIDLDYQDLLGQFFTRKNMLFVGCSFTDPAVRAVFECINKRYGPTPPGLHLALIPEDVDHDFITRLSRLNIETIRYSPENYHQAVWDAFAEFNESKASTSSAPAIISTNTVSPLASAKRYLASCYARIRLGGRLHPLREAVVEGMVSSLIQASLPKAVTEKEISKSIHEELALSLSEATELVDAAIARLADEKLCRRHNDNGTKRVVWCGEKDDVNALDAAIASLTNNIVDRAVVQEGLRPLQELKKAVDDFLRELVLQRGWDLGAAFASNSSPEGVDIGKFLYQFCAFLSHVEIEALKRVCVSMFTAPTEAEDKILAELGRASFALEMVIRSPRGVLFHSTVLPQKIYLDANVLMPALTQGHAYYEIYRKTIKRLREATIKAGGNAQIIAYQGFLNEIVSHRRLAIQQAEVLGDSFREDIVREALFYGTTNMNVFVGAYANSAQSEKELEFQDFLKRFAPYTNENELAKWLHTHGIIVQTDAQMRTSEYAGISFELQKLYSGPLSAGKLIGLIEHDAVQLSSLMTDHQNGLRSIFVTADKRLTGMVCKGSQKYKFLSELMISNVGLTQMIDLLVGDNGDTRGLTNMLWSAKTSSKTEEVRKYLVSLALREYDEALAMEMPKVIEKISDNVVAEAERLGLEIDSDKPDDRRKLFQIIGTFEDGFFAAIREKIELRQRQERQ